MTYRNVFLITLFLGIFGVACSSTPKDVESRNIGPAPVAITPRASTIGDWDLTYTVGHDIHRFKSLTNSKIEVYVDHKLVKTHPVTSSDAHKWQDRIRSFSESYEASIKGSVTGCRAPFTLLMQVYQTQVPELKRIEGCKAGRPGAQLSGLVRDLELAIYAD